MLKKRHKAWSIGLATNTGPVKQVNEDRLLLRLLKDQTGVSFLIAGVQMAWAATIWRSC